MPLQWHARFCVCVQRNAGVSGVRSCDAWIFGECGIGVLLGGPGGKLAFGARGECDAWWVVVRRPHGGVVTRGGWWYSV